MIEGLRTKVLYFENELFCFFVHFGIITASICSLHFAKKMMSGGGGGYSSHGEAHYW